MSERLQTYDYFLLALVTLVLNYFWVANCHLYVINSSPLLSFINHYQDGNLYGADSLLIRGFDHYYTYYFKIAAFLSQYVSIKTIISLLSLIPGLVIVPAIFSIGYMILRNKYAGYLTILILLTHWQLEVSLGDSEGFGNNLAHATFATSFLILAFAFFLKNHRFAAFSLVGLMMNFHAPLALGMLGILFTCSLTERPINIQKLAGLMAISLLAGLPTWVWYWKTSHLSANYSATDLQQWHILYRLRSSGSPFNWYVGRYIRFMAFGINMAFLTSLKNKMSGRLFVLLFATVVAIVLLCTTGLIFGEILNFPLVTQLSLFRSTRFIVIISAAILASYVVAKIKGGETNRIETLLASLMLLAFITWNMKIAILTEVVLFAWLSFKYRSVNYVSAFGLIMMLCIVGLFFIPKGHFYPFLENPALFFAALAVVLLAWAIASFFPCFKRCLPASAVTSIFLLMAAMGSFDAYSEEQKVQLTAQKEAEIWISSHTPENSNILIPPNMFLWENYSKRSNFLTFCDLAFAFYDPAMTSEIAKRINDYGIDIKGFHQPDDLYKTMYEKYYQWDKEHISSLAKKNNIHVMVVELEKQKKFELPLMYENRYFQVYQIN